MGDNDFYLVGEVYNYGISGGKFFDFGDKKVNYYDDMFTQQINFEFKWNAKELQYETMFRKYDQKLQNDLKGYSVLNYLSSHDDGQPFDPNREKPFETANKLLLSPGASQVYYGDEMARILVVENAVGDANLRSMNNWDDVSNNQEILNHWFKLGQFRRNHPAVGAGKHQMISKEPYVFSRTYSKDGFQDSVVVCLKDSEEKSEINVSSIFQNDDNLIDYYSGEKMTVKDGKVITNSNHEVVLLEKI